MTDRHDHNRRRVFWLAASLLWMVFIFAMSARPADVSSEDSSRVGRAVLNTFCPGFREMPEEEQEALIRRADRPVRKTAHALEYAVLGALAGMTAVSAGKGAGGDEPGGRVPPKASLPRHFPLWAAWLAAVVYAGTDELHQAFVPGRACRAGDVAIDAAGAAAGVLIVYLIQRRKGGAQT